MAEWLLYYEDRLEEYRREREDILEQFPVGPVLADKPEGKVSDPTGRKVVCLDRHRTTAKWLKLVEDVEKALSPRMRVFLELRREYRYYRGRNGWMEAVRRRYAERVAAMEGVPEEEVWVEGVNTFSRWWGWIVDYAAREAARRGLL